MKKKLLAILMSLSMMLTFMPAMAFADSEIELNAWLKWTEVDIPGNTPVIIAEAECSEEDAELSYSWKYRPSGEDPDAEWEELEEHGNMLELTTDSGNAGAQYLCCVTASINGEEVASVETDPRYYSDPYIEIVEDELSIDQSVDIEVRKRMAKECVRFVPEEDGVYSFAPSSGNGAEPPNIWGILFDARGVQFAFGETQLGVPVGDYMLAGGEAVYVSFFYQAEDEDPDDTYDVTVSVRKVSGGGEGDGEGDEEEFEGSFDYEGIQYYYSHSESVGEEYVKEVVNGDTLTISPFDAYTFWYKDENNEKVPVTDPADQFGDKVTYEWTRLNYETDEWDWIGDGAAYTKENAEESDAGYYVCKVIYQGEELLNLNAQVIVLGSVEINGETYTYSMDTEGEAHVLGEEVTLNNGVRFRDSSGEPADPESLFSKIEWYRLTEEDGEQKVILVSGAGYDISQDGSLHIDKVTGQDYGEYVCRMYYDDEKYIKGFAELQMGLSLDMWVDVGISQLNGVGNHDIIYSHYTKATPCAKISYEWYYRDFDIDDSYTGDERGSLIEGETKSTIEPKYGNHYYHGDVTASMKGYEDVTVGSNINYITEFPVNYLDRGSQSFDDGTSRSINVSLNTGEEASKYYSFTPAANKVYELTAKCSSGITDPIGVVVYSFDSNGVRTGDEAEECITELPVSGTAVQVLTFESGSAADPVYFAPFIREGNSGSADITFEIKQIGEVPVYHVVEFETDNGEIMPSQLVKDGEKLTPESEPGKEGYEFDGWYEDAGCTAAFDLDTSITADITLYAKWEKEAECEHNYVTTITKATFDKKGRILVSCDKCGDVKSSTPIPVAVPKLSGTSFTYNGKVQTPTVSIAGLKSGTDYTVSWSKGRKDVGTYTATITLKGSKYKGTKKLTYTITPKGASIKNPAKAKKAITVKWAKQSAKMSKATITGYQIQYSTNSKFASGNKTVTVKGFKKTSQKISKLKAKTMYYVRVRTYMKTGGKTYYSGWSKTKSVKTK